MNFKQVLVEKEDIALNKVFASSGLLFDEKFVIVTSNIFEEELKSGCLPVNTDDFFYLNPIDSRVVHLNVVESKSDDTYVLKSATVFATYCSKTIEQSNIFFKNFTVDTVYNNKNTSTILSVFFILSLDVKWTIDDFKYSLTKWWNLVGGLNIRKCDEICVESAPFGNRSLSNSKSWGIVSNMVGKNSCLILSDCPTAPGSEGSPVYARGNK